MVVTTSHGTCARIEEGNVINGLKYLFPDIQEGSKISGKACPKTFFCEQRRIFKPVKHLRGIFLRN